jgi:hypothetical protein
MEEYIKVFTGSGILVNRLNHLLKDQNITTMVKDEKESGRLAGFGTTGPSVELLVLHTDIEKSSEIIENFREEISK